MSEDRTSVLAAADRLAMAAPAAGRPSGPVAVASTRKLAAMIVMVEFAYGCALAAAIPHGTPAVGVAIAMTCLLAIWLRGRFDRETAGG